MQDSHAINRRSFLEILAGTALTGVIGCGPAHKIGEKWGWCCDKKYRGPSPKPGAALVGAKGAQFDESRLIEKINSKMQVYEPDPDLLGFVNAMYQRMHGSPIPSHLTYEFSTNTLGGGIVGRYLSGHIVLAPGLIMSHCIHFLLHEIGHDFDIITFSETVAEFEAVRGTLESLAAYPTLNKETNYALLSYAKDWLSSWGGNPGFPYACASQLSLLSIIKNQGDLARAQQDINLFYLSQVDAEQMYGANKVNNEMSSAYYLDELIGMSMASWLGLNEQKIPEYDRPALLNVMRKRNTVHEQNIWLPTGITVPLNYEEYLARSVD